jgi:hypothetical protein
MPYRCRRLPDASFDGVRRQEAWGWHQLSP